MVHFFLQPFKSIFVYLMQKIREINRTAPSLFLQTALLFVTLLLFSAFIAKRKEDKPVFTTTALRQTKTLELNDTKYTITVTKKCIETGDPPYDCRTVIKFSPAGIPDLVVHGDAYAFAAADINRDGKEEVIALASEHGTWRTVSINALSASSKETGSRWYRPVSHFLWRPGFEGDNSCHAKLFWLPESKQVKVLTTNSADESFACTKEELLLWHAR